MLGLSLHGWENIMLVSLALAAVFAAAVGISTYCVVQLQRHEIEESKRGFEHYKLDAAKVVASAASVGETAKAEAAKAIAQTAEADARTKEAELKLEQLRDRLRPRRLKSEQFLKMLEGKPKAPVEILFVRDDGEAFQLSLQIRDLLRQASWEVEEPRPIVQADMEERLANVPSQFAAGGQPDGVSVFLRAENQADFEREKEHWPIDLDKHLDTPRKALSQALLQSLGAISGGMSGLNGRPGVLRVIVGPKPHPN